MPKSIQIFLCLLTCAVFLVCVYYNQIEENVVSRLGPRLLGSKLRNLQSSDGDPVTGVTPLVFIKSTNKIEEGSHSLPIYVSTDQNLSARKIDLAVIFCNAGSKPALKKSLELVTRSLLKHCNRNITIHFHLITDVDSWQIAKPLIFNEASVYKINVQVLISTLFYRFHESIVHAGPISPPFNFVIDSGFLLKCLQASVYFISTFSEQFGSTIELMQKHFSAKPGTYYSQALFYASIHLPDLLPSGVDQLIFIDIDTDFRDDIDKLSRHFDQFDSQQLMGLAPELSPVYRHILYLYRNKHKMTLLGEPKGRGFPGFNSGIVLMKLNKLRQSELFKSLMTNSTSLQQLVSKYSFKGHLGDQDFYTLVGLEHPELFYILPCNWNRQLCQWWKSKGYDDVFEQFYECKGVISLYHGNCNSQIPNVTYN